MKLSNFLKYDEDLTLQKKTVVILRWIALIGQLITIYVVHFLLELNLPIILCSITIFCGGLTNIIIQYTKEFSKKAGIFIKEKVDERKKNIHKIGFDYFKNEKLQEPEG